MKRTIVIFASGMLAMFLSAQNAGAFPGERLPYRTAHFAHRVAYNINYHVVQPTHRVIVRHTR